MDTIRILEDEHRLILHTLDALEAFADAVDGGATPQPADLTAFVEFLRFFADQLHHAKEEDILFDAMRAAGFPERGPIAVMLGHHEESRRLVAEMADAAERAGRWSRDDERAVAGAAHDYVNLLRGHIRAENEMLYPLAEVRLPPAARAQVDRACVAFERDEAAGGEPARLRALAAELASRFPGGPAGARN
jgi:hemerythrin-like domain-containing protein